MKKKLLVLLLVACSMFTAAGFVSCTDEPSESSSSSQQAPEVEQPRDFLWTVAMPNGVEYQNVVNVPAISVYEECRIETVASGATYSSSDSTVASVSTLGVVRGLKAGSVTVTITAGEDVQAVHFIINEAGNVPVIVLENSNVPKNEQGQYECSLFVGGAMNVGAKLKYNGMAYTSDVAFTYESDNNEVATITNGVIRAISEGTVTLRVSTNEWRGYTGTNLVQTITVYIKPNASLSVAEEEVELYTKALTDEITTFNLMPKAIVDEVEDTDATFGFTYDEEIVSVSASGEVTAVGEGETEIVVNYTTDGGYTIEKTVSVRVILPIANSSVTFTVDKSGTTVDKATFNLLATENYVRIADEATGASGAFVGDVFTGTALPSGERTLVVYSNKQGYRIQALVVDKIIKTEAELRGLQTTEDVTAYYVLGDNITLTGTFTGITTGTFTGTFDGMGYAISGLNVSATGLLGVNAKNVVVKNVAFPNALYSGNTAGVIARSMSGNNSVENVFISFACTGAWSRNVGSLCFELDGTLSLKNAVIYHANAYNYPTYPEFGTIVEWNKGTINTEKVYVASDKGLKMVAVGTECSATNYTTLAAMKTAYANKEIDISWASGFAYYSSLQAFLTA